MLTILAKWNTHRTQNESLSGWNLQGFEKSEDRLKVWLPDDKVVITFTKIQMIDKVIVTIHTHSSVTA